MAEEDPWPPLLEFGRDRGRVRGFRSCRWGIHQSEQANTDGHETARHGASLADVCCQGIGRSRTSRVQHRRLVSDSGRIGEEQQWVKEESAPGVVRPCRLSREQNPSPNEDGTIPKRGYIILSAGIGIDF
jgi:hypothetical protein